VLEGLKLSGEIQLRNFKGCGKLLKGMEDFRSGRGLKENGDI
jgi:hypothetical protein